MQVTHWYAELRLRFCKNPYIREEALIKELLKIIDQVDINELGMRHKLEDELGRFAKFQVVLGGNNTKSISTKPIDIRTYAKYLLQEGSTIEKRELLGNLRTKLIYKDKTVSLVSN